MYRNSRKKIIHVITIIVIIFAVFCIAGILALKYQVEGETNLPFEITKISIIESSEGIEQEGLEEKWNFNVNQNNDIYIYIEKNSKYDKTEIIEEIKIDNIIINKNNSKGETKLYKPVKDEKIMFKNITENEISEITYTGELESNIKEQKISNQGGIIVFRYAINNIAQYVSNENDEIDYSKLLQLTGVKQEDLQTKLSFNITIKLTTGRKYQATIDLEIPTNEIIEKGTVGIEKTDLKNIIFKRIEN